MYSMYQTSKFTIPKQTRHLHIPFYVDSTFAQKYNRQSKMYAVKNRRSYVIQKVEDEIERNYLI
jgi:hypothetical protein